MEGELDAVLDPLARATMAAWDGEPSALRLVTSQARPVINHDNVRVDFRDRARPTLATTMSSNVVGIRRYANRRHFR